MKIKFKVVACATASTPAAYLMQEFERRSAYHVSNPSRRHFIDVLDDDDMGDDHTECGVCSAYGDKGLFIRLYNIKTWEIERDRQRPHP